MEPAFYAFTNEYEPDTNPNGIVALAVAENKLMHRRSVNTSTSISR